ncbi:MAG: hypothetical protein HGA66_15045, partial [Holophaga sp.]|nr:hypothetical protein [Holophaga sp.]
MIVNCPSCASRFQYGEERFLGAQSKRFRCPKCGETFEVTNPALVPGLPPAQATPRPLPPAQATPRPLPPAPPPPPPPPPPRVDT